MTPEPIDELKALSPGCDVWMVADPAVSKWTRKIDWYLGFQMMKAAGHTARELPPELKTILQQEEIELPSLSSGAGQDAPLMVASCGRLPAKMAVVVPFKDNLADWAEKCHGIWQNLKCPPVRVFLPDAVSADSFISSWPAKNGVSAAVEVVVEAVSESN